MIKPGRFVDALEQHGVTFFTGVPDSLLKELGRHVMDRLPRSQHIIAANEGAAVGIGIGHFLRTSQPPAIYMQNSGLGNAINPLLSLADPEVYGIPMLVIIGWRGEPGMPDEPQHVKQGRVMTAMLDAMEIPWAVLPTAPGELDEFISDALKTAVSRHTPFAIVVKKGTFAAAEVAVLAETENTLRPTREQALSAVVDAIDPDAIVVSTTGMLSRELYELRQASGADRQRDFLTVGGMGHASAIALGVALREPDQEVWCLDGDGAVLMHLGSLAVIGDHAPPNFRHVVFNNGVHDSVGGQRTSIEVVDLPHVAVSSGYRWSSSCSHLGSIGTEIDKMRQVPGPTLLELGVAPGARADLGRPTRSPAQSTTAFMKAVGAPLQS